MQLFDGLLTLALNELGHSLEEIPLTTNRSVFLFVCFCLIALSSGCGEGAQPDRIDPIEIDLTSEDNAAEAETRPDSVDVTPQLPSGGDASNGPTGDEALQDDADTPGASPEDEAADVDGPLVFMPLAESGDVVAFVDIDRYMGRWYELATTPSFQQAACSETQAEYVFNEAQGWVDVTNRCASRGNSGRQQEIQGRAELVDTETQAKLAVSFFGQSAPYWVVALDGTEGDEPYQWAVVSGPGSQFMWILSRTTSLGTAEMAQLYAYLTERGFPVDSLVETVHTSATE